MDGLLTKQHSETHRVGALCNVTTEGRCMSDEKLRKRAIDEVDAG